MTAADASSAIPAELRARQQWVVWKFEERDGKLTKCPRQAARPGARASSTDPRTWASYETAIAATGVDGIGFVFTADDPLAGVDLDGCIDPETGEVHPDAAAILDLLGGYQEPSPSRIGMHAIVEATLAGGRGRETQKTSWCYGDRHEFAVYDRGRFFTVTGAGAGEIRACQAELDEAIARMFGPEAQNGSEPPPRDEPASDEPARTLEQLLDEFPELKRIAAHDGKGPKDTTDSGWDFYLACEAVRCGCTDAEIGLLIGHARNGDEKASRASYIDKTIEGARKTVAKDTADPAARISKRWNLGNDPIVSGRTIGDVASGEAKVYLTLRSDRVLRFPRLGDLFEPRKHNRLVGLVTRSEFKRLSENEAHEIALAVIKLCGGEDVDPLEEARDWVIEFVAHAGAIVEAIDAIGRAKSQWDVLIELQAAERDLPSYGSAAGRSAIIRKGDELWLPAGALKESTGGRLGWGQFGSALVEIGWRHEEIDVRAPSSRGDRPDASRVHRRFWVGKD